MSLGRLWSDGVLFGPNAGALVVDPSPLLRSDPPPCGGEGTSCAQVSGQGTGVCVRADS